MTIRPRRTLWLALLALCAVCTPSIARADDGPLPKGVVAIVRGKHLTFDGFCLACARHALRDLKRLRSGPRSILEQLIEEAMVVAECKKLGITVTQADVKALWKEWDGRLRRNSNGHRTLRQTIKEQGTTEREFIAQMWHMIRKERIAKHPKYIGKLLPANEQARLQQIGIVIGTLRKNTVIKYGVLLIDHVQQKRRPDDLGEGVVATVDNHPITMQQFGRALVLRLPAGKVREYLDMECKTALMMSEGVRLSDEELQEEVDRLENLWPLERQLQREEIWRTVSFKDRFETELKISIDDIKKSGFYRGMFGLVRKMRGTVTEAEIREEFKRQSEGRYGAHILVTDVVVRFAQKKGFTNQGLRNRDQALRSANTIHRRLMAGERMEKLASEINLRQDRTFQANRVRIYKTNRDLLLYDRAAKLRDGDTTPPFETLSEVHVIRREGMRPARRLEEVRPHVIEIISRRKAREWLDEKLKDPKVVRVRWPLPERK